MKRSANLGTIEIKNGFYKEKPYVSIYACYVDDFGGHRDKVLCKEDAENFCKDYAIHGVKIKRNDTETDLFSFAGMAVYIDTTRDKYKEGNSVVVAIAKRE